MGALSPSAWQRVLLAALAGAAYSLLIALFGPVPGRDLAFLTALIIACVFFSALFPGRRNLFIALCSVVSPTYLSFGARFRIERLATEMNWPGGLKTAFFYCALGTSAFLICNGYRRLVAKQARKSILRHRPLTIFIITFFVFAALAHLFQSTDFGNILWVILYAVAPMIPFLAYDLESLHLAKNRVGISRLGLYRPIWTTYFIMPFPKGEAYQNQIERSHPLALLKCQLSGLRLLAWAGLLGACHFLFNEIAYEAKIAALRPFSFGIPHLKAALTTLSTGGEISTGAAWLIAYCEFFDHFLFYTILGHAAVGIIRTLGFNAFRNTYRPLQAKTVLEFFNRYNYYFKEFLLHFFYYPAFFKFPKTHPRLRVTFAVFASAGVGNFLVHFIRDIGLVRDLGWMSAIKHFFPYAIYCGVLSIALSISLIRQIKISAQPEKRSSFLSFFVTAHVLTFFTLLQIFDDRFNGQVSMNLRFFARLWGF